MIAVGAAVFLAIALPAVSPTLSQSSSIDADLEFLRKLSDVQRASEVDRPRLAMLFAAVSVTLERNAPSVNRLRLRIPPREPNLESVSGLLGGMYENYTADRALFRAATLRLSDAPRSTLRLYRSLVRGQRACWRLDRYLGTIETYSVSSSDLMTVISSRESCVRFNEAALHPAVEGIIHEALRDRGVQSREIRELQEELTALEELVQDLTEIERSR